MSEYYEKFTALNREQRNRLYEIENENDFDNPEQICCPYCNIPQSGLEGEDVGYEQDDETEHVCDSEDCGKKFIIGTSVRYSWTTCIPDEEAMDILESELSKEL